MNLGVKHACPYNNNGARAHTTTLKEEGAWARVGRVDGGGGDRWRRIWISEWMDGWMLVGCVSFCGICMSRSRTVETRTGVIVRETNGGTTDNSSPQFLENKTVASAMSNSTLLPGCRRTLEQVPQIGNEAKIYQMKLRAASGRAVSHFGVLAAVEIAVVL